MKKLLLCLALTCVPLLEASAKDVTVNTADISPYTYEANDKPAGMAIDILQAAGKASGISFHFNFLPWKRAQLETQSSTDHAIVPLTRTPERENDYQWIVPLFEYHFVIVTRADRPAVTFDETKKMAVGVLRGNPMHTMLPGLGFGNVRPGNSEEMLAKQLRANLIDVWIVPESVARDTYKRIGGNLNELRIGTRVGEPMSIYLAASKKFPAADVKLIADEVNRLRASGEINRILERYRN
jgi:polar amino acid transport system substrate-binding protein